MTEPTNEPVYQRGLFNMTCFNGLGKSQQKRLVEWGNLPMGYEPEGWCHNPAEVEVDTKWDKFPGPRFYCLVCAIKYLIKIRQNHYTLPRLLEGQQG